MAAASILFFGVECVKETVMKAHCGYWIFCFNNPPSYLAYCFSESATKLFSASDEVTFCHHLPWQMVIWSILALRGPRRQPSIAWTQTSYDSNTASYPKLTVCLCPLSL